MYENTIDGTDLLRVHFLKKHTGNDYRSNISHEEAITQRPRGIACVCARI